MLYSYSNWKVKHFLRPYKLIDRHVCKNYMYTMVLFCLALVILPFSRLNAANELDKSMLEKCKDLITCR